MFENEDLIDIPILEQMELKEDENSIDQKDFKRIKDVDVNIPYITNFTSTKDSFIINDHNYLENLKNEIKEKEKEKEEEEKEEKEDEEKEEKEKKEEEKEEEEELFSSSISNEEENIKIILVCKSIGKKRFRTNFKKITKKKSTTSEKIKCILNK